MLNWIPIVYTINENDPSAGSPTVLTSHEGRGSRKSRSRRALIVVAQLCTQSHTVHAGLRYVSIPLGLNHLTQLLTHIWKRWSRISIIISWVCSMCSSAAPVPKLAIPSNLVEFGQLATCSSSKALSVPGKCFCLIGFHFPHFHQMWSRSSCWKPCYDFSFL